MINKVCRSAQVLVQSGGKPVIFKFLATVMLPGDEVLYPTPGYPIYESLTRYLGGVSKQYIFREAEDRFELDLDQLRSLITPKTKVLIVNNYQNPTGWACSDADMQALAQIAIEHNLWVLSDEAYFHLSYEEPVGRGKSIVSLPGMKERTVILLTFSKSFSMVRRSFYFCNDYWKP